MWQHHRKVDGISQGDLLQGTMDLMALRILVIAMAGCRAGRRYLALGGYNRHGKTS
jgi:hypothetical protein